jgi:hypothetical protein
MTQPMENKFLSQFNNLLTPSEKQVVDGLDTPYKISLFLDTVQYPGEERNRSVINVLRERQAHCLDGGMFATAMLNRLGYPAIFIDILPEPGTDDDHILALFRQNDRWGCVAKSNFTGLRYRDPIYRSLRELVMSYFEIYFNMDRLKTLRGYTRPVRLARFQNLNWLVDDAGVDEIEKYLKHLKTTPLLTDDMIASLSPVDERSYKAGMFGVNLDGLYKG